MLKRLVIGAIVGVAAYVLSLPRKGTVEWHKAEYFSAAKSTVWDRLVHAPLVPALFQRQYERNKRMARPAQGFLRTAKRRDCSV